MSNATSRPWLLACTTMLKDSRGRILADFDREPASPDSLAECRANAELAHRAINSHDALVAALRSALSDSDLNAGRLSSFTKREIEAALRLAGEE